MSAFGKRPTSKGRRLYRCQECGTGTFFTRREEDRAGRLHCNGCGSARLEVSAEGADRLAEARAGRAAQQERHDELTNRGTS